MKKILVLSSIFILLGFIVGNYLFSKRKEKDINKLIMVLLMLFILTILTYNGILSLMPSIGTLLYTLSVWQNDTKTYKKYGILVSIFWITYHIYVKSLFGIILESILLISVIIGLIKDKKVI